MIFGIVGNALCCYAVVRFKFLRTVPNYFMTSLAVSDLYKCLIVMPLSVYNSFNQQLWFFGNPLCYVWSMSQFVSVVSSILILAVISADRLLSIVKPVSYSRVRRPGFALCVIAVVWLTSMTLFVTFSDTQLLINNRCLNNPRDGVSKIVGSFIIFWIPLLVVIAINLGIARVTCKLKRIGNIRRPVESHKISPETLLKLPLKKSTVATISGWAGPPGCSHWAAPPSKLPEPIPPSHDLGLDRSDPNIIKGIVAAKRSKFLNRQQDDALSARKRRAYIVIAVVIGSFILCWMPFFFMSIHSTVCPECYRTPEAKILIIEIRWLGYLNSTINPIIYALVKRDYRRALKLLVQHA